MEWTAQVISVAEYMGEFILASLGVTYLIALGLILARPANWRLGVWVSQIVGFGATCFVMDWIGLQKALGESAAVALAGAGVGALAAWRWDILAEDAKALSRARRRVATRKA